ncbi:MAG TPA: hypothetical protein EYN66_18270, partial [Myxococcales bacterium]|nr:hypothetical protein [Myxococcales bacterium]
MRVDFAVFNVMKRSCNYVCVGALLLLLGACSDGAAPGGTPSPDADTASGTGGDLLITAGDDGAADGDVDEIAPPEYFEKPCTSNDQCVDENHPDDAYGYCVEFNKDGEKKCTTACTTECPAGYGCVGIQNPGGSDGLFVCMPELSTNCNSCESDEDCVYEGARCIEVGLVGGETDMRCAQDCSKTSGQCDEGYICQVFPQAASADEIQLCVPSTGSCICFGLDDDGVDIDGSKRDCEKSNEFGTCKGQETCAGEKGWGTCDAQDPAEEICDGLDNNCDAQTDENLEDKPCSESNDFGTCEGNQSCDAEKGYVCDALIPVEELCDGKDNNCNGEIDEGFDDTDGDKTADCVDEDCDDDGILDGDDNCVCTANKDQLDTDKNGFGDACDDDFDGDTVPNDKDNC